MPKQIPSEHLEQAAVARWLRFKRVKFAAVPNGFFTNKRDARFYAQIKKLKDEGYSPGFVDMLVFKFKDVLFLEMKRSDGGTISAEQQEWHDDLRALGLKVAVCSGFKEAKQAITAFLEEK